MRRQSRGTRNQAGKIDMPMIKGTVESQPAEDRETSARPCTYRQPKRPQLIGKHDQGRGLVGMICASVPDAAIVPLATFAIIAVAQT
jgi:hypothetical protein